LVSPCLGLDNDINVSDPEFIAIYQLTEDICPHLSENNQCEIRSKRPLVCRAFPLSPPAILSNIEPMIMTKCRYVRKRLGNSSSQRISFYGPKEEEAYKVIINYFMEMFSKYKWTRFYNPATKSWIPQIPTAILT
jgi:Fe-S-cluster containining protein